MYVFQVKRPIFCTQCRVRAVLCDLKKVRKGTIHFPSMWWAYLNYLDIREDNHAQKQISGCTPVRNGSTC